MPTKLQRAITWLTSAGRTSAAQARTDLGAATAGLGDAASRRVVNARMILAAIRTTPAFPAVTADVPVVTSGASATVTTGLAVGAQTGGVTVIGRQGSYDVAGGFISASPPTIGGLDFFLDGATVEILFRAQETKNQPIWIFVDGAPISAAPDTSIAVLAGSNYYVKLVFGASARRRIEFFAASIGGWLQVRAPLGSIITPAPRRQRIAFVGDSFFAGSGICSEMESAAFMMSRMLGLEMVNLSYGGTGYTAAGLYQTYGSEYRIASVVAADPAVVVISGSVNDPEAGLAAATAAAYAAYEAALPGVPLIVFSTQPTTATDTIGATRAACIAAQKAAADAAENVIAFYDMVGTAAGIPAAYDSGTTYSDGDRVTHLGAVWSLDVPGGTKSAVAPGATRFWRLETYGYWGTGRVGASAGDGDRDVILGSDGVHPTTIGSRMSAVRQATKIVEALESL